MIVHVLAPESVFAQVRKAPPAYAPSAPRVSAPAALPASSIPDPASFTREASVSEDSKGFTVRMFVGPAFELGRGRDWKVRRSGSLVNPTNAPAGASFTATSSSSTTVEAASTGDGIGVMYGLAGDWWVSDRFGWTGSLFGTFVGSGATANVLAPSPFPANRIEGSNTVTFDDETTVTSGLGATYTASVDPTPAGGGPGTMSYGGWAGLPGGGGTMQLRTGSDAGANPDTYESQGGVAFATGRSTWLNEFGVAGTYRVAETPGAAVSFFGGLTVPVAQLSTTFQARTVGAQGQGKVATETQQVDQGGGATYTQRTEYELDESIRQDATLLAAGPMIGLDAACRPTSATRLYARVGYAPILVGSLTTNSTATLKNRRSVVIENIQGTPAGVAAGTRTLETQTTTPNRALATVSGSETLGVLGASLQLGPLSGFVEGVARGYSPTLGLSLIYGLNLGAELRF
jgi:hypothetical protein